MLPDKTEKREPLNLFPSSRLISEVNSRCDLDFKTLGLECSLITLFADSSLPSGVSSETKLGISISMLDSLNWISDNSFSKSESRFFISSIFLLKASVDLPSFLSKPKSFDNLFFSDWRSSVFFWTFLRKLSRSSKALTSKWKPLFFRFFSQKLISSLSSFMSIMS